MFTYKDWTFHVTEDIEIKAINEDTYIGNYKDENISNKLIYKIIEDAFNNDGSSLDITFGDLGNTLRLEFETNDKYHPIRFVINLSKVEESNGDIIQYIKAYSNNVKFIYYDKPVLKRIKDYVDEFLNDKDLFYKKYGDILYYWYGDYVLTSVKNKDINQLKCCHNVNFMPEIMTEDSYTIISNKYIGYKYKDMLWTIVADIQEKIGKIDISTHTKMDYCAGKFESSFTIPNLHVRQYSKKIYSIIDKKLIIQNINKTSIPKLMTVRYVYY